MGLNQTTMKIAGLLLLSLPLCSASFEQGQRKPSKERAARRAKFDQLFDAAIRHDDNPTAENKAQLDASQLAFEEACQAARRLRDVIVAKQEELRLVREISGREAEYAALPADVRAAVPDTKAMKVKAAMKLYDDAQKDQRSADLNQTSPRGRRLGWKPSD